MSRVIQNIVEVKSITTYIHGIALQLEIFFKAAGYFVYSVQKIQEVWPKNYFEIEQQVSPEIFATICDIGGKAFDENRCLIIAYK